MPAVAASIALYLSGPIDSVCLGPSVSPRAMMTVPEAAVNEDYFGAAREDQVWFARQIPDMKSIAIACPVQQPSD